MDTKTLGSQRAAAAGEMLVDQLSAAPAVETAETPDPVATDRAAWLELLSEELLAELPLEAWRKLFLGADYEGIRFAQQTTTLLCADAPGPEWSETDVRMLATRLGGWVERHAGQLVMAFSRPRAALEVALLLQRSSSQRLRCALRTAPMVTATFELDGETRRLTLGHAARAARACADNAPPGSVHLCAATWRAVGAAALERLTQSALVTTEYQGEEVTSAFITLPPPPRAALSTFAGLGLV